jgi:hypothetical protein
MKGFISDKGWLTRAAVATVLGCMSVAVAPAHSVAQLLANVGHASAGCARGEICVVSQISVAQLQSGWVVTAFVNSSNNLELIAWQWTTESCGKGLLKSTCDVLKRRGSQTGSPVICCAGSVAIVGVNANRVVTAVVNQQTTLPFGVELELTTWSVNTSAGPDFGAIAQEDHIVSTTPPPNSVSMTRLNGSQVVTAILTGCPPDLNPCPTSGMLSLAAWGVSSTGTITAQGTAQSTVPATANDVWPPGITNTNSSEHDQVVTAYCTGSNVALTFSSWNVSAAGTITLQQNASAGSACQPSLTSWGGNPSENVAAAFSIGAIEVINWTVDPATGMFTRQATGTWGEGKPAICAFRICYVAATTFANQIFTAADGVPGVPGAPGAQNMDLSVTEWEDSAPKLYIVAQGDSGAHNALVAAAPLDDTHTVTASANSNFTELEVNVWSYGVK